MVDDADEDEIGATVDVAVEGAHLEDVVEDSSMLSHHQRHHQGCQTLAPTFAEEAIAYSEEHAPHPRTKEELLPPDRHWLHWHLELDSLVVGRGVQPAPVLVPVHVGEEEGEDVQVEGTCHLRPHWAS